MKTTREILIDYITDLHPEMPVSQVIHGVDRLIDLANKPQNLNEYVDMYNNSNKPVDSISGLQILGRLPTTSR